MVMRRVTKLLVVVPFPVFPQVAELGALEATAGVAALVRPFASVSAHVSFQVKLEAKPFAAHFTEERLFPSVREHVSLEFGLVLTLLPAYLTVQVRIADYKFGADFQLISLLVCEPSISSGTRQVVQEIVVVFTREAD